MAGMKLMTLVRTGEVPDWAEGVRRRLGNGLPGASRIVLNLVLPVEVRATDTPGEEWNAVIEGWFATRAEAEAARTVFAQGADVAAHLLVDEQLIHDSGIRPLVSKVMVVFRRRPDMTRAAAQAHWRGRHVELGLVEYDATQFLRLYFQNHVVPDNPVAAPEHDYDGSPVFWMDPDEIAKVGADSPVMKAIAEDERNFADRTSLTTLLVSEETVFDRAA